MKNLIGILIIFSFLSCKKENTNVSEVQEIIPVPECSLDNGNCYEIKSEYVKNIEIFQIRDFFITEDNQPFLICEGETNLIRLNQDLSIDFQKTSSGLHSFKDALHLNQSQFIAVSNINRNNTRISKCNYEGGVETSNNIFGENSKPNYNSIIKSEDDNFIMVGTDYKEISSLQPLIIKINENGEEIWAQSISAEKSESLETVINLGNNSFVAIGTTRAATTYNIYDIILYTFDGNGENIVRSSTGLIGREAGGNIKSIATSDLGFLTATSTRVDIEPNSENESDYQLSKFNNDAILEWNLIYGGDKRDLITDIIESNNGGYFLLGSSTDLGFGHYDIHLTKISETGQVLWKNAYYTNTRDFSGTIYEDSDSGDLFLTGATGEDTHLFVIRLDENGTPQ